MVFPDVSEIELRSPSGGQSNDYTDEVAPFGHGIHYDHNGILPIRLWQFHYEIDTDGVPRSIWDREWV